MPFFALSLLYFALILCTFHFEDSMKKITVFFLFFAIFCMFFKMFAEDDEDKLRLAVMEFEDRSGNLSEKTLSDATEYIRGAFVASNKFIVIAKERQENAMIQQMKKESYKLCNDKKCQIPLGQALSADTILRTTITFLGGQYTITSELIDLAKEATTKGAKATFDGDEKSLISALNEIVSQIIENKDQANANSSQTQNTKDKNACEYAKKEENLETWNEYLRSFPNGECSFEAKSKIKKLQKSDKKKLEIKHDLQWSNKASEKMKWKNAVNYCRNLTEGGFDDWRLPNIDELRTLIIDNPDTETGGTCKISEKNHQLSYKKDWTVVCNGRENKKHSKLNDTGLFWSSSVLTDFSDDRWNVGFNTGRISNASMDEYISVRCVRGSD